MADWHSGTRSRVRDCPFSELVDSWEHNIRLESRPSPTVVGISEKFLSVSAPVIVTVHERVQTEHLELSGLVPIPILPALRSADCPRFGRKGPIVLGAFS